MKEKIKIVTNGLIKENPVLVLVLGTCPTLATSTNMINAIGMGIAATLVLIFSNLAISMLKSIIPDKVRIPCYIVVIAGLVTVVEMLCEAFVPSVYNALGIFLPLIVVNCIILGRAEMFAGKNGVIDSALDGLGMGLGFTLALILMSTVREFFGAGTFLNIPITADLFDPIAIFGLAPGGFFVFGLMIALINKLTNGKGVKRKEFGCQGCPGAAACASAAKGE